MIDKVVFFDFGGVLGAPAISSTYETFKSMGKNLCRKRLASFFMDDRTLTGPKGTLEHLLKTDFKDLNITIDEIMSIFGNLPLYSDVWNIARELRRNGVNVGVISDQFTESSDAIRNLDGFTGLFNPILFSPEVKLTKKDTSIFYLGKTRASKLLRYNVRCPVMVDDREPVLEVARRAGYYGLLFDGDHRSLRKYFTNKRFL